MSAGMPTIGPPMAPSGSPGLGLTLDPALNAGGQGRISAEGSAVSAWVVPTDEQRMIARYTRAALRG